MSASQNGGRETPLGLAEWLGFAAAPAFATMAVLTAMQGGPADMLCAAMPGASLGGMVPMYMLMSAVHSAPWIRKLSDRRREPAA
jgi:hypothetical protein